MIDKRIAALLGVTGLVGGYYIGKKKTERDFQNITRDVLGIVQIQSELCNWIPNAISTMSHDNFIDALIEKMTYVNLAISAFNSE